MVKRLGLEDTGCFCLLGFLWNLVKSAIQPQDYLNMFGKVRVKSMGPKLSERESSIPLAPLLTRHNLLMLCAQMYNRSGRLFGPAICTMKVLLSRACEIAQATPKTRSRIHSNSVEGIRES